MSDKQPQGHCPWCGAPIFVQWVNDPDLEEPNPIALYSCGCRINHWAHVQHSKTEIHQHHGDYKIGLDPACATAKDESIVDSGFVGGRWVKSGKRCPNCDSEKFMGDEFEGRVELWRCFDCGYQEELKFNETD